MKDSKVTAAPYDKTMHEGYVKTHECDHQAKADATCREVKSATQGSGGNSKKMSY